MAGGRTTTRKRTRRKARRRPPTLAERFALPKLPALPHFEQRQLDVIGLAMAAASIFFGLVFYLGWDGGKVGEALAKGFIFMFGGVAYLVPVALFCWGALLVVRPMLPTVKPFKSGSLCLLTAYSSNLADLAVISVPHMEQYASRHGYQSRVIRRDDCERQGGWFKIEPISDALEAGYDFVFWLDIDTLILRASPGSSSK